MADIAVEQETVISKDLFGFCLTYPVPLLALSGVAVIPLESYYIVKVNCRFHLLFKLQENAYTYNICWRMIFSSIVH